MAVGVDVVVALGFIGFGATICTRQEIEWSTVCSIFPPKISNFSPMGTMIRTEGLKQCEDTTNKLIIIGLQVKVDLCTL